MTNLYTDRSNILNSDFFHSKQKIDEIYFRNMSYLAFCRMVYKNKRLESKDHNTIDDNQYDPDYTALPAFVNLQEYYKIRLKYIDKSDFKGNSRFFPFPGFIIEFQVSGFDDILYGVVSNFHIICDEYTIPISNISNWWFVDKNKNRILNLDGIDLQTLRTNETELTNIRHFLHQYFN